MYEIRQSLDCLRVTWSYRQIFIHRAVTHIRLMNVCTYLFQGTVSHFVIFSTSGYNKSAPGLSEPSRVEPRRAYRAGSNRANHPSRAQPSPITRRRGPVRVCSVPALIAFAPPQVVDSSLIGPRCCEARPFVSRCGRYVVCVCAPVCTAGPAAKRRWRLMRLIRVAASTSARPPSFNDVFVLTDYRWRSTHLPLKYCFLRYILSYL